MLKSVCDEILIAVEANKIFMTHFSHRKRWSWRSSINTCCVCEREKLPGWKIFTPQILQETKFSPPRKFYVFPWIQGNVYIDQSLAVSEFSAQIGKEIAFVIEASKNPL